jgi:hypothetical protein
MFTRFAEILPAFFAAMLEGYVGANQRKHQLYVGDDAVLRPMPGAKANVYQHGDFKVVDSWFVTPLGRCSAGFTNIWCLGDLVWHMGYQGWYRDPAVPFLKSALKAAYEKGDFIGGRGPLKYGDGMFRYTNRVVDHDWRHFRGREVVMLGEQLVGFHEYHGLLLADH